MWIHGIGKSWTEIFNSVIDIYYSKLSLHVYILLSVGLNVIFLHCKSCVVYTLYIHHCFKTVKWRNKLIIIKKTVREIENHSMHAF